MATTAAASKPRAGATPHGEYDMQVKLLLIGDSGVGKTCLIMRYVDDKFSSSFLSTIGIDFKSKLLTLAPADTHTHTSTDADRQRVKVQIWDTAGQERFRTISVSFFRGAHGIALVFDLTDRKSFSNVASWMRQVTEHADEGVAMVLLANKADLTDKHAVAMEEAQALGAQYGVKVFFTSAKANTGVSEAFEHLAREAMRRALDAKTKPAAAAAAAAASEVINPSQPRPQEKSKSGCACGGA